MFETFVETQSPALVGFYRRLGAGAEDAEDLVQELFLRLFRCASSYVPKERFEAYCYRIARNAWIDRRRRAALRPTTLSQLGPDPEREGAAGGGAGPSALPERCDPAPAVDERLASAEEAERLRAACARLPEAQRLVFELGVVQELPYAEIADLLQVPQGTVKSRMFHAVRRLRELMGEAGAAPHPAAVRPVSGGGPESRARRSPRA